MNILRSYKRSRLFLLVNITGLAIGLATSIMLLLFVVNELSYDKSIKDNHRIISLNTVTERGGDKTIMPIATRRALTDVPSKVPGIEVATQIYSQGETDIKFENENFQNIPVQMTESGFFDVFSIEFLDGNKDALEIPNSAVITEKYAKIIFGTTENAMNKVIKISDYEFTIRGIIKGWPRNTHFSFEILVSMDNDVKSWPSIEFFTFYKIKEGVSMDETRAAIEKEYTVLVSEFLKGFDGISYGQTEKFTDLYLKTQAYSTLGKRSSMSFVWLLTAIAIFILLLAITNFINLFIAQGETRMLEIGVRKTNGATIKDIAKQFLTEILVVVFIAFIIGFILLLLFTPYFAELINRDIDLVQLYNPTFIFSTIIVFILTVVLSASYPIFYLARFNTLEILSKRIRFSKRRLTSVIIVFQAVISIVIISYILVVNKQTEYLKDLPLGYNPKNVLIVYMNNNMHQQYSTFKQELEKQTGIVGVAMAHHAFGYGGSGQGISLLGQSVSQSISEYRISEGICEIVQLQLVEGEFYRKDDALNNGKSIILNEAAIKMLGLNYPVVGTTVDYKGQKEIRAVVKDFYFGKLENQITPMVLSYREHASSAYIKYADNLNRREVQGMIQDVLKNIDSAYTLSPLWLEDIYKDKFRNLEVQSRILMLASLLSIFISMIGLLAIHAFNTIRRKKELSIRRVNGASRKNIFEILSRDILIWIGIAGIIAIPIAYYFVSNWLDNYPNRTSVNLLEFVLPIIIQCIIAIAVTSGISLRVLTQNPVDSLRSE